MTNSFPTRRSSDLGRAQMLKKGGRSPVADLCAKAFWRHFTHSEHDMRMRLGFAVDADVPMHVEIGDHAAFDELTLDELARERDPLLVDRKSTRLNSSH